MTQRERAVVGVSALLFVAAAAALALLLPSERVAEPVVVAALVAAYALVSRVRFEFGSTYVTLEQLAFVPMLVLLPLGTVPLLVAGAAVLAMVPDFADRSWHRGRWLSSLSDCWFSIGPVLVIAALAPGEPTLDASGAYLLAFAAQLACDLGWAVLRDRLVDGLPAHLSFQSWVGVARVDAVLAPIAFVVALAATEHTAALLTLGPFMWLLQVFSRERQERYAATLKLHRAYRGTVMLLSDVIEFEDAYTARHSRSIVELVDAVADELRMDADDRRELEFAALLHDVGKIAVPKEILNKPEPLTGAEAELMRGHTIEGQLMLDRVGGLLARVGELVRSCHERWDGSGYPDGLAGEEIPLASRIVFACDSYSAMTTDRTYSPAVSHADAMQQLAEGAGTQFDPLVISALLRVLEAGEPTLVPVGEVRTMLTAGGVPGGVHPAT